MNEKPYSISNKKEINTTQTMNKTIEVLINSGRLTYRDYGTESFYYLNPNNPIFKGKSIYLEKSVMVDLVKEALQNKKANTMFKTQIEIGRTGPPSGYEWYCDSIQYFSGKIELELILKSDNPSPKDIKFNAKYDGIIYWTNHESNLPHDPETETIKRGEVWKH